MDPVDTMQREAERLRAVIAERFAEHYDRARPPADAADTTNENARGEAGGRGRG